MSKPPYIKKKEPKIPAKSKFPLLKPVIVLKSAETQAITPKPYATATPSKRKSPKPVKFFATSGFHTCIRSLNQADFKKQFSNPIHLAEMVALYKIRRGTFCDCPGNKTNTLPERAKIHPKTGKSTDNPTFITYCTRCGSSKKRNLYQSTPLGNRRTPLTAIFQAYYYWFNSKPDPTQDETFDDDNPAKAKHRIVQLNRSLTPEQLAKKLGITEKTAQSLISLFKNKFRSFWSQLPYLKPLKPSYTHYYPTSQQNWYE